LSTTGDDGPEEEAAETEVGDISEQSEGEGKK